MIMRWIDRALPFMLLPLLAGSAFADDKALPDAIAAPGETVVLKAHAIGLQLYECKPGADGKLVWTFTAPQATLNVDDKDVGQHGAGPSWELNDGSGITGKVAASAPGATVGDIPWLKLDVVSHKGSGQLSNVTTVQRINTIGGQLKDTCDRAGASRGMPYSADYVFLRKP
jgi:hypothetical protein